MLTYLLLQVALLQVRRDIALAESERGSYSADVVIWTAAIAVAALTIVGAIVVKLAAKEASISLD